MNHTHRMFALSALALALAACSSPPERNHALERAQSGYSAAAANPQVAMYAPEELKSAGDSLATTRKTWSDGAARSRVDHQAYMTQQRIAIAQDTASRLAAQAVTTGAAAERDRMRLAQRTSEVDSAQRQLAMSEQGNAQKSAALATADAMAERDKARIARREARVLDLETQLQELNARKTDHGMVVTLGDVLFDSGRHQLLPEAARNMNKLGEFFRRNPRSTASIEGHTDSVGDASANLSLSDRRAHAVLDTLVALGVASRQLSTKARGEATPVASNDTPSGRQQNRRVEIVFAPQSEDVSLR